MVSFPAGKWWSATRVVLCKDTPPAAAIIALWFWLSFLDRANNHSIQAALVGAVNAYAISSLCFGFQSMGFDLKRLATGHASAPPIWCGLLTQPQPGAFMFVAVTSQGHTQNSLAASLTGKAGVVHILRPRVICLPKVPGGDLPNHLPTDVPMLSNLGV
jgi:hypothetical protein|tara:strand:- start:287 stop:763 length:477 start_codon:yes stop_codon:yes gene_type:complete